MDFIDNPRLAHEVLEMMCIAEAKHNPGKRVGRIGNINCRELLSWGSKEEVTRVVRQTIQQAAPWGGYIMSSSNTIHASVKPENYLAMIEATHQDGRYPS